MKLILTSHNLQPTEAIESHIRSRIEKLEHIDPKAIDARVNIEADETEKGGQNRFRCSIRLHEAGRDLFAEDTENDLYAAIDLAAKKIGQQVRRRHSKEIAQNRRDSADETRP